MLALLCSEQIAYGSVEQVVTADNISRLFGVQAEIVKHPSSDTPVVIGI
jgi:ABC-type cobalamin/Fe3+-siderophores transport system ATPase subunit